MHYEYIGLIFPTFFLYFQKYIKRNKNIYPQMKLTSSLSGCENTIGWPVSEASLILRCKGMSPKRTQQTSIRTRKVYIVILNLTIWTMERNKIWTKLIQIDYLLIAKSLKKKFQKRITNKILYFRVVQWLYLFIWKSAVAPHQGMRPLIYPLLEVSKQAMA